MEINETLYWDYGFGNEKRKIAAFAVSPGRGKQKTNRRAKVTSPPRPKVAAKATKAKKTTRAKATTRTKAVSRGKKATRGRTAKRGRR